MVDSIKAPCELEMCNALRQDQLDEHTRFYIAKNCREEIALRLSVNPDYDITQCPVAGLAAAVIMRVEGEREIDDLLGGTDAA